MPMLYDDGDWIRAADGADDGKDDNSDDDVAGDANDGNDDGANSDNVGEGDRRPLAKKALLAFPS